MRACRKLFLAVGIELLLAIVVLVFLLFMDRAADISWGVPPGLWDWQVAVRDSSLLMAWGQYMVVGAAVLLAWLCWHRPGYRLSIILLAWAVTWLPMVGACTFDMLDSPNGPWNLPMGYFLFMPLALTCLLEALVLFLCIRIPGKADEPREVTCALILSRLNTGFFVFWCIWCFYRGVLCSLTFVPDFLAPQNFSSSYVTFSFILLLIPMLSPCISIVGSLLCLLARAGRWGVALFILLFSCATMAFRIGFAEVYLPWWF